MEVAYSNIGKVPHVLKFSVYADVSGSDMVQGALVGVGASGSESTHGNCLVLKTGEADDVVGLLTNAIDVSAEIGLLSDGSIYNPEYKKEVILADELVIRAEYDQSDTMLVAAVSSADITITGIDTTLVGGAVLGITGDGLAELNFIKSLSSNTIVCYNAHSYTAGSTLIKILPPSFASQVLKLNTTSDKIGSDPAKTSTAHAEVLRTFIQLENGSVQELNFAKHDQVSFSKDGGTTLDRIKVFSEVIFKNVANLTQN